MANKDPSRTEKATPKKVNEARQDGNVLKSEDVNSFLMVLGGVLILLITVPVLSKAFYTVFVAVSDINCRVDWSDEHLTFGSQYGMEQLAIVLLPGCGAMSLLAIISNRLQVGKYFSIKALKWKFNSLNPSTGFKQLLPNKTNMVKLVLTLGKVSTVGLIIYLAIKGDMDDLQALIYKPIIVSSLWLAKRCYIMIFKVLVIYAVIAAVDYIYRRKKYQDDLMMTKQEVKDERKNAEGDPRIKGKIRQKMRELMRMRMVVEVPNADVVVTNPTHVAVAIRYEKGSPAPRVVAKGLRKRAERIKELARHAGVPIIEAPPLARSLYRNTKSGAFIPPELYGAVAAILARLHREGKRMFATR